jgi:hypothetical protein
MNKSHDSVIWSSWLLFVYLQQIKNMLVKLKTISKANYLKGKKIHPPKLPNKMSNKTS